MGGEVSPYFLSGTIYVRGSVFANGSRTSRVVFSSTLTLGINRDYSDLQTHQFASWVFFPDHQLTLARHMEVFSLSTSINSGSAKDLAQDRLRKCLKVLILLITWIVFYYPRCFLGSQAAAQNNPSPALRESPGKQGPAALGNSYKLELQKAMERELSSNEVHYYRLEIMDGYFIHVQVLQQGIDVVLTLRDPRGQEILRIDSPNGTNGPESLSYIAKTGGTYSVTIAPLNKKTLTGRYLVKLENARLALSEDSKRVEAERAFAKGLDLSNVTEGPREAALVQYNRALTLFGEIGDRYFEGLTGRLIALANFSAGRRKEAIEQF